MFHSRFTQKKNVTFYHISFDRNLFFCKSAREGYRVNGMNGFPTSKFKTLLPFCQTIFSGSSFDKDCKHQSIHSLPATGDKQPESSTAEYRASLVNTHVSGLLTSVNMIIFSLFGAEFLRGQSLLK